MRSLIRIGAVIWLCLLASTARADRVYTGPLSGANARWNNATNWSPQGFPQASDNVFITTIASASVTLDVSAAVNQLQIGNPNGLNNTLTQSANVNLTAVAEGLGVVGYTGGGTHIQSAGTNTYSSFLQIGDDTNAVGTYSLSGSGRVLLTNPTARTQLLVGGYGAGTFLHSASSVRIESGDLAIGYLSTAVGTYLLSSTGSVTLTSGQLSIGLDGRGLFQQNAGTVNITAYPNAIGLLLGTYSDGAGTYSMGGGSLSAQSLVVGHAGAGTFNQTGGTTILNPSGPDSVALALGYTSGSGTFSLSSGNLTMNAEIEIGLGGTGNFIQTGGAVVAGSATNILLVALGSNANSKGTYSLSAGTTQIWGDEFIGGIGDGTFTQTGGTHTLGGLASYGLFTLGDNSTGKGTYALSGASTFNMYGPESIGYAGVGTFTQTGGTHNIRTANDAAASISIAEETASSGAYTISGGTFSDAGDAYIGGSSTAAGGNGTFTVGGGTVSITGTMQVWSSGKVLYNGGTFSISTLQLNGGGHVALSTGANKVLRVNNLSINSSGAQIDLSNNSMVIDYTGAVGTRAIDTRNLIKNNLLSSSSADALHRLGYADNNTLGTAKKTTFGGYTVDATSILIKYTFAGDADLNGTVDVADFTRFFANFGTSSNALWQNGDFDYNGVVDVADFTLFFSAFGQSGLAPTPEMIPFMSLANVPEPTFFAAFALIGILTSARVNHHSRSVQISDCETAKPTLFDSQFD